MGGFDAPVAASTLILHKAVIYLSRSIARPPP